MCGHLSGRDRHGEKEFSIWCCVLIGRVRTKQGRSFSSYHRHSHLPDERLRLLSPQLWALHDQRSWSPGHVLSLEDTASIPLHYELQLLPVYLGFFVLRDQKARGGITILTREGRVADTQEGRKESMWNLGDLLGALLELSCPTVTKMENCSNTGLKG